MAGESVKITVQVPHVDRHMGNPLAAVDQNHRADLVQAMGILFTLSTAALALSLQGQRLISAEMAGLSALALVPAMAGMVFGQAVRRYLSEARFRRVFFAALLALGGYIAVNAILRLT